jgi:hypothetical protein
LLACLEQVLRPIIRLFLARRVAYPAFAEVAKRIYIELAREDAAKKNPRQPVTVSEIAIATGLSAKAIGDRLKHEKLTDWSNLPSLSPEALILGHWATDSTYSDLASGDPLELPIRGKGLSFATLVRRTHRNVSYGHVLDKLIESGNVELSSDGRSVTLKDRWYRTSTGKLKNMMEILTRCLEHFLKTLTWNINQVDSEMGTTLFQQERYTQRLNPDRIPEYRQKCMDLLRQQTSESVSVIEPMEDPVETANHRTAGVGYYYFEL